MKKVKVIVDSLTLHGKALKKGKEISLENKEAETLIKSGAVEEVVIKTEAKKEEKK